MSMYTQAANLLPGDVVIRFGKPETVERFHHDGKLVTIHTDNSILGVTLRPDELVLFRPFAVRPSWSIENGHKR